MSFALRAVITFLKENLFVDGLAFSKDIDYDNAGMPTLNDETVGVLFPHYNTDSGLYVKDEMETGPICQ